MTYAKYTSLFIRIEILYDRTKTTIKNRTRQTSKYQKAVCDSETIFHEAALGGGIYLTSNILTRFGHRSLGKLKPR